MGRGGHIDDRITGQHLTFMKTGAETGGDLLQVDVRLDAGGRVPRHAHLRQDERVEVISGSLTAPPPPPPPRHMEQAMKGLFAVMRPLGRILPKASGRSG